jgi:hypothetical protein
MTLVKRDELLDYATYADRRATIRPAILEAKRVRRICIGAYITLLIENHDTVLYQIQEMTRIEHIVRERDILHELSTYNELLGGPGEFGATLLIGIDDETKRDDCLRRWLALLSTLYAELDDGTRVAPTWDERQVGDDRLSSVQYLKFNTQGAVPVKFGCSFDDPDAYGTVTLSEEQRAALTTDLQGA